MWYLIWPIALVVLSNVFYNIVTKSTPADGNAFLSLTITYLIAAVCTFIMYLLDKSHQGIVKDFAKLNWTSFALGIIIVGLEFGYIHVYRAGWNVNTAPLVANICLSCVLLVVGFLLFKEKISVRQIIGFVVCVCGLILITV